MLDNLIQFFTYNKLYLISGIILLFLCVLPTKGRISPATRKYFFLALLIWSICFGYRFNTGQEIIYLFNFNNDQVEIEEPPRLIKGPFNKYYTNEAGRTSKSRNL